VPSAASVPASTVSLMTLLIETTYMVYQTPR
jgi:hypothetical protein